MNYKDVARQVLILSGGKKNIQNVMHCMTRLRINVNSVNRVGIKEIEAIDGVLGTVVQGNEVQIIIGTNVDLLYKEVIAQCGLGNRNDSTNDSDTDHPFSNILELLSSALSPAIPVIMGAAFITIVITLLSMAGVIDKASQTYVILSAISNCVYYFFPVIIAYTMAQRLKVNIPIAIIAACFLLYPDFISLFQGGEVSVAFIGIPVKFASYSKQIFPIVFSVIFQYYVEKLFYRIIPKSLRTMVASGLILMVTVICAIIVFGPIGALLTEGINIIVHFIVDNLGWFAIPIIAFINPFMLGTGLGSAMFPIMITAYVSTGYEALVLPAALAGNMAQVGAGIAISKMTRNKELKEIAVEGSIAALMGVTEPIIFSVHYKLKKTFFSVMLASFIAALIPGIAGLKCFAMANGILSLPAYLPGGTFNFIIACVTLIAGFMCGYIITRIIGFTDTDEGFNENHNQAAEPIQSHELPNDTIISIQSPIDGKILPMDKVKDTAFAEERIGRGIAIIPVQNYICAPISGTVVSIFPTKHAIGIVSDEGVEVLVHIGIDTYKLGEKEFNSTVNKNDRVEIGDKLVDFDLEKMLRYGYDMTITVVVINTENYLDVVSTNKDEVTKADTVLTVIC